MISLPMRSTFVTTGPGAPVYRGVGNGAVAEQTIPKVIPAGSPSDHNLSAWTTKGGCGSASPLASTNPYAAHMVTRDDHLVGIITLKDMMTLLALKMDLEGID